MRPPVSPEVGRGAGAASGPDGGGRVLPFVQQLYAFGMTIVAGVAAGVTFDLYRLLRRGLRPKGAAAWLADLLFWLVLAPVVFSLLLLANWGELRFYVLLGLTAGAALYFGLLSEAVAGALYRFFWGVGQGVLFVARTLVGLFALPFQGLHWLAGLAGGSRRWWRKARPVGFRPGRWLAGPLPGPWRPFGRRV